MKNGKQKVKNIAWIALSFLLCIFSFHKAHAAVLYSQAANQDTFEGQTFVVDWYLDTENQSINVVDLRLNFSKDTLEVSDINSGSSLLNLWIKQPSANNNAGTISLTGGISSGINGSKVPIFRTLFSAKTPGEATITLDPSSVILLNDGQGTKTLLKFKNESFNIYPKDFVPVKITSSTHPSQDSWYKNRDVSINFEKKSGTSYSYSFSSNIELIPDNNPANIPDQIVFSGLPDGIYYFKLNSRSGEGEWQEAGVYRVQIDNTPPETFEPQIGDDPGIFSGRQFVSFSTVDKTSGISHYKVKFGWFGSEKIVENQYIEIPKFFLGDQIKVTAYDKAGNSQTAVMSYDSGSTPWLYAVVLVLFAIMAGGYFWRRKPKTQIDEK